MTKKELELLYIACYHYKHYLDSNPDVGMGPSLSTLVDEICEYLTFQVDQKDRNKVVSLLENKR